MSTPDQAKHLREAAFNAQLMFCEIKGYTDDPSANVTGKVMAKAINAKAVQAIKDLKFALEQFDAR